MENLGTSELVIPVRDSHFNPDLPYIQGAAPEQIDRGYKSHTVLSHWRRNLRANTVRLLTSSELPPNCFGPHGHLRVLAANPWIPDMAARELNVKLDEDTVVLNARDHQGTPLAQGDGYYGYSQIGVIVGFGSCIDPSQPGKVAVIYYGGDENTPGALEVIYLSSFRQRK